MSTFEATYERIEREYENAKALLASYERSAAYHREMLAIHEQRIGELRGRLCALADEEAREDEKNLPTSWSRLTP